MYRMFDLQPARCSIMPEFTLVAAPSHGSPCVATLTSTNPCWQHMDNPACRVCRFSEACCKNRDSWGSRHVVDSLVKEGLDNQCKDLWREAVVELHG
ncbi:hypothetical protein DL89DRAFT_34122 [Linderina pennispora]|uniref:Uncharacterized protein n=1 Tax=Linderina pennispora TaxID=61395 RepID=A0A1Y1VUC2_9FUNG|nr:uncharacterized protein DL89DRAFT_34122 [Linderina pennispora]ORX64344.1 hypothetical protein DL89DRAFT_34122 [Linderina pennispora]